MLKAWHTASFGEVGGPITGSNVFGNNLGHPAHGGTASRRQAVLNPDSVSHIVRVKKATKQKILPLVGLLQHRMYNTAARIKELHYYTTLTKAFKSDLRWWHFFVNSWNGVSFLKCYYPQTSFHCQVATDVSGSSGCISQFRDYWFQYAWPAEWSTVGIMAKELVPIVIGCAVWLPVSKERDRTEMW